MSDNEKRSEIIDKANSPLGFYVLALLVVEAFIASVLILSDLDQAHKFEGFKIGVWLFIGVVAIVSIFTWFKPQNIMYGAKDHLVDSGKMNPPPPYGDSTTTIGKDELEEENSKELVE